MEIDIIKSANEINILIAACNSVAQEGTHKAIINIDSGSYQALKDALKCMNIVKNLPSKREINYLIDQIIGEEIGYYKDKKGIFDNIAHHLYARIHNVRR